MNLTGLCASAWFTFRRILPQERQRWLLHDVLALLAVIFAGGAALHALLPRYANAVAELALLLAAGATMMTLAVMLDPDLRRIALRLASAVLRRTPRLA